MAVSPTESSTVASINFCPICKKISLQSSTLIVMELLVNSISSGKASAPHSQYDISGLRLDETPGERSPQAEIRDGQNRARKNTQVWGLPSTLSQEYTT